MKLLQGSHLPILPSCIVLTHNALSLCRHMYEYVPGSAIVVIKLLRCHVRLFVSPLRNQRCLFVSTVSVMYFSSTVSVLIFSWILFTNLITLNLNQFRIFVGYLSYFLARMWSQPETVDNFWCGMTCPKEFDDNKQEEKKMLLFSIML